MRGRRGWVAVGTGLVLLLLMWANASRPVGIVSADGPSSQTPTSASGASAFKTAGKSTRPARAPQQAPTTSEPLGTVTYLLLAVPVVTALAFLVVFRPRLRRRRAHRAAVATPDEVTDEEPRESVDTAVVRGSFGRTVEDQLSSLDGGSARNAIVDCWLALEASVAAAGLPRNPADTAAEFSARVHSAYSVDARAIDTLAALYREARFSSHDLDESRRIAARAALRTLRQNLKSDLTRSPVAAAFDPAGSA